jgi:hypothetical protein
MSWRHLYLWIAPLVMCVIDASLTLAGQPEYYWGGYYHHASEASPDAQTLLTIHPAVFVFGISVWMVGAAFLLVLLPTYLALVFSTIATIGHTLAAASWMVFRFHLSYQAIMGLCAVAGLLLATSITLELSGGRLALRFAAARNLVRGVTPSVQRFSSTDRCWGRVDRLSELFDQSRRIADSVDTSPVPLRFAT